MTERKISAWVTIKHHHIPIYEGETKQDVINRLKFGVKKGKETRPIPEKDYIKKRDAAQKAVNALEEHQKRVNLANERIKTDTSEEARKEKLNADRTLKEAQQRYDVRNEEFKKIEKRTPIKSIQLRKKQVDKELSEKQEQISRTSHVAEQMNNDKQTFNGREYTKSNYYIFKDGQLYRSVTAGQFPENRRPYRVAGDYNLYVDSFPNAALPYSKYYVANKKTGEVYQYEARSYGTEKEYISGLVEELKNKSKTEPKVETPKEPEYEKTPKMEWIDKRIEGKQKEIDKLEKKMERINKAKESDYKENNPYYYSDYDFRVTTKDLERAKADLEKYKQDMEKEIEKAKSRNVPVITEFLDDWEKKSIEYFKEQKKKYDEEALPNYRKRDKEYVDWLNYPYKYVEGWDRTNPIYQEMYRKKDKEHTEYRKFFKSNWHFVTQFNDGQGTWEENMLRAVRQEKYAKYDDIITRTNDLIGQITDAGALHIGKKGDLNGVIVGSRGKAKVETIGAGGYNIQRYHFRTLINKLKEK